MATKKVTNNAHAKHGKPRITFSEDLFSAILARIASGESMNKICSEPDMPTRKSFYEWVANDEALRDRYAYAMSVRADFLFDELIDIADTPEVGVKTKIDDTGKTEETRGDMIEHRRLRVDARKWYLSKLAPKKYGDKVNLEHTGADGGAVKVDVSDTERARRIAFALRRGVEAAKQGGE